MRMWLILFLVGGISACATPAPNPWQGLDTNLSPAADPIHCVLPRPDDVIGQSIVYETAHALEAYRLCSEANEAIVIEHAAQIGQLKIARKGLVEAGQAQRRVCDLKDEIIKEERQHFFWQSVGQWVVIGACGLAL